MIKKLCCLLFGWIGLAGCASVDVAKYRAEQPALDLRTYFNGTLDAWGMFQDRSGEVVKLFVVRRDPTLTVEDLAEYCKKNLTGYKRPREIAFCDELPKTNVGKILRRELRDADLKARAGNKAAAQVAA